jgi:hypothetical protein
MLLRALGVHVVDTSKIPMKHGMVWLRDAHTEDPFGERYDLRVLADVVLDARRPTAVLTTFLEAASQGCGLVVPLTMDLLPTTWLAHHLVRWFLSWLQQLFAVISMMGCSLLLLLRPLNTFLSDKPRTRHWHRTQHIR